MGGTGLATAYSTRPLLPLSLRSEQATRAKGRPYAHGRTLHSTRCRHCRTSWKKRGGNVRRWRRGLRPIGRGWRPIGLGRSRCFSGCKILARGWVNLCHLRYSLLLVLKSLLINRRHRTMDLMTHRNSRRGVIGDLLVFMC